MESERSGPHRKIEKWLQAAGINYESEYKSFPPFSLDMYLPEWHVAVEADGPYHLRRKDSERDTILYTDYGILVLHIKTAAMTKNATEQCIQKFIEESAPTAEKRKLYMRSKICGN